MNHKSTHHQLFDAVSALLESSEFITGDREKLKEDFIDTLYTVLQTSLDVSITKETLEAYIAGGAKSQDPLEEAKWLHSVLENDKTYILLNYYFVKFIQFYIEATPKDKRAAAWKLVEGEGITLQTVEQVDTAFADLTKPDQSPRPTTTV